MSNKGHFSDPEAARKAGETSRTHGLYAFRDRGPDALVDPTKVSRLSELRDLLATFPGRLEVRRELSARVALIVELGVSHIYEIREENGNIWSSGVIKRLGTYIALLQRLLDNWPDEGEGAIDVTAVLEETRKRVEQD